MNHFADPDFWKAYNGLPDAIRELADKNFVLLKSDPAHPSLRLKRIGTIHSVRVGLHDRALAIDHPEGLQWFWIGHHSDYDRLIAGR